MRHGHILEVWIIQGTFSLSISSFFFFFSLFFLTGKSAAAAGDLDEGILKSWLRVLQPHAVTEDLAAFALPPGVVPLCEDGALFERVQKAMSSWDTVGPVRATARGPLRIPGTSEARVLRTRPSSNVGGARGVRGHQSPGPESRAAGKRPRLEASARRPTAAESASTAAACGGSIGRCPRGADGSPTRDPPARATAALSSPRPWSGGRLASV